MLVLVSFGLVLLATILLVVGLLSDDGINLIYLSIAASATAAVVLFLAFRIARPKGEGTTERPEPLAEDIEPTEAVDEPVADATTVSAAISATPEPVPAPTEDDWADDADWEIDDELGEFPIADYEDLTVAEILPLLPQLYSDELDVVRHREQGGKNRASILAELERLAQTGTDADALEAAAGLAPEPPPPAPAPSPAPPSPAAAPPIAPRTSLLDDDDFDDDAAFFPIADYDDLSVSQIMPLLPQLELDELSDVRSREVAGANRATLVAEIDRYLSGELEAYVFEDVDEPEPVIDPEAQRLPIADYPHLDVSEVVARLDGLTPAQIEQIIDYEAARDNRRGIIADAQRRLDEAAPAAPVRPRPPKRAATKRTTAKATTRKATARKTTARKATPKKTAKRATRTTATRKTAKKASTRNANRFPIATYDELPVAAIRPQLAGLTRTQLEQVRVREESGAGRKTILNDIDKRLAT